MDDKSRYADHWLSFWNDLLRNDYEGTGYIDGGRQQITPWLYDALLTNKPLGQFVRDLIEPAAGAEGFVKGIVWRGSVNASQRPPIQAAQNLAQVFLGINLKCASCHDSFVSQWKLRRCLCAGRRVCRPAAGDLSLRQGDRKIRRTAVSEYGTWAIDGRRQSPSSGRKNWPGW